MSVRTDQYVDLVPRESVHERDNLEIEFVQRRIEVDHKCVEGVVVIRDVNIQVLFCGCTKLDHIYGE